MSAHLVFSYKVGLNNGELAYVLLLGGGGGKPIQNKTYGVETAPDEQKESGDQELLHGEAVDSGW